MNNKKNILIISPFFFPEPISTGKYNTELALALRDKGHDVTFLCFHPFYPEWKIKKSNLELKNIKIVRGGRFLFFTKKTFLRRIILELSFTFFVIRKLMTHQKNKDILITIFPPSLAFYVSLPFLNKKLNKIGIVHDLQEIYSAEKKGFLNKVVKFFIHKVENKCFQKNDKLIFLSNEMKKEAITTYNLEEKKLNVQYPFINISLNKTDKLSKIINKQTTNIVYSGALGEKQNPFKLYDFFNKASVRNPNLKFYFFSEGLVYNQLKSKNSNKNILFYNLVDKENLKELYDLSDVQIIPQKENTSKGSLPSKLPNILASRCKVMIITDLNSEIEKIFKENNLTTICTNWDIEYLIKSLNELLKSKVDYKKQNEVAKELFSIDSVISEILI